MLILITSLSIVLNKFSIFLKPPENFGKDPGPYQRVNPLDRDLKILGPEDLGQGPTVKVFDNKTLIIGIEFRLAQKNFLFAKTIFLMRLNVFSEAPTLPN